MSIHIGRDSAVRQMQRGLSGGTVPHTVACDTVGGIAFKCGTCDKRRRAESVLKGSCGLHVSVHNPRFHFIEGFM